MIRTIKLPRNKSLNVFYNDKVYNPKYSDIGVVVIADALAKEGISVIDVACGSGLSALCLKYLRPDLEVSACDIDHNAVEVTERNKYSLGLDIEVFKNNLLHGLGGYDMIMANLPTYTAKDMLEYELHGPKLAYYAGRENGLILYKRLFVQSEELLSQDGILVCECQAKLQTPFLKLADKSGFKLVTRTDFAFGFRLK